MRELKGELTKVHQIDNTLSKSGYVADAKAAGDAVKASENRLNESIDEVRASVAQPFNFKGSCLSSELPETAELNDTWYCTDLKYNKSWNGEEWHQSSVDDSVISNEVSELKETLENQNIIPFIDVNNGRINCKSIIGEVLDKTLISSVGQIVYSNIEGYKQHRFGVISGEKYYITTTTEGNAYSVSFFSSAYPETSNFISGLHMGETVNRECVTIPEGVTMMCVTEYNNNLCEIIKLENSVNYEHKFYKYEPTNNTLFVGVPFKEKDVLIVYKLSHKGGNNLYDFEGFYYGSLHRIKENGFIDAMIIQLASGATDLFAPYNMKAVSNADGDRQDNTLHFTGGNHEYTNSGYGGTPTAREISFEIVIDGVNIDLTAESLGNFESIGITWINNIQASNTKKEDGTGREVLTEKHTLKWCDDKWETETEFIPLEDVVIRIWYAFQGIGFDTAWNKVKYIGSNNRALNIAGSDDTFSNGKACSAIRGYKNNGEYDFCFEIGIDETFDIGKREYLKQYNGEYYSALTSLGKAYMCLIGHFANNQSSQYDEELVFSANNHYLAKGSYQLKVDKLLN